MMKKQVILTLVVCYICSFISPTKLLAEDDFSNTSYWNNLCTNSSSLTKEEQKSCEAYINYMKSQNTNLQAEIDNIDAKKKEIAGNIQTYAAEINTYNSQIASLNEMIDDLNIQITATEQRVIDMENTIKENQESIKQKEEDIEGIKQKIENHMVQSQETMRINHYIDILFGTSSFADFLRVISGINDISASDANLQKELNKGIEELELMNEALQKEEEELLDVQKQLAGGKSTLATQQTQLLASRYEAELIVNTYNQQITNVDEELLLGKDAISANEATISNINQSIEESIAAASTPEPTPTPTPEPKKEEEKKEEEPKQEQPQEEPTPEPTPEPEVEEEEDPWGTPKTADTSGNPYYGGWSNCTWGAWQIVHDTYGISLPGWGWSTNWINDAAASGYATGSEPRAPSIGVYENHVAVVVQVSGDQVYIREGNYLGHYMERWVPIDALPYTNQKCLGFIYL